MTVVAYRCDDHGERHSCDVDEVGERVCVECGEPVTAIVGGLR